MKLAALRIRSREHRIDMGDGHEFKLSRGTFLWFLRTRWKYPLPSDHFLFVTRPLTPRREEARGESAATDEFPARHLGEEVLIIQSADPPVVLRVLDRLKKRPLFMNPRYTLFCRNLPGVAERFCDHPMLYRVISHNETRGAFAHLASLRRENFDAVVVFFTGDPSYWKIKFLPFLLGARHKLIFNENDDCFFFSWRSWQAHMSRRLAESVEAAPAPRVHFQLRSLAIVVVKLILFPFRLAWLLLVWLRLRSSEIRLSG